MRGLLLSLVFLCGCSYADKMAQRMMYPVPDPKGNLLVSVHGNEGPLIFYYHGNGEDVSLSVPLLELLSKYGTVIAHEYPGYGPIPGVPSQTSIVGKLKEDLKSYVEANPDREVIVLGRSLGAAVAMQLAGEHADKLILISPWTTAREAAEARAKDVAIIRTLIRYVSDEFWKANEWNTVSAAKGFPGRALVIHGREDDLVPFALGQRVASALSAEFVALDGMKHNDVFLSLKLWESLGRFIENLPANSP